MEEIIKIYDNEIGIAFHWKNKSANLIQLIFRDTGFHLTVHEIEVFLEKVLDSKNQKNCATCVKGDNCKSILLQTPSNKVSMAVSIIELSQIDDLLKGTLFQMRMNNYLNDLCKN
ncbi:hypothetical protein [Tenacibaculum soleae]|uniref:Uncharacterized protein n=1 Tax=Tenacibaculum soleae TaxID=447689 RepID=A0A1B9Y0R3_9FLAO|nr:hypothetical protein [Tenacibaculum soleae]MDO6743063.1 hypothetical protein [Tenacibaculum soleae]MDO6811459.1 hypothetical protein [Tenacibaculum soleae]OCK43349.1 hypothetical protein BA195_01195 [Tenacibaculum soleae]